MCVCVCLCVCVCVCVCMCVCLAPEILTMATNSLPWKESHSFYAHLSIRHGPAPGWHAVLTSKIHAQSMYFVQQKGKK